MSAADDVLVSLGCDYITATAKERHAAERLHEFGSNQFRVQRDFGNKSKPWGMAGFTGFKCGSVQVGSRGGEVCVRLSSDSAARSWRGLLDHAQNVSRIDLQATVRHLDQPTRVIDKHRRRARKNSEKYKNRRRVRWVQEHHGGYTLYVGNRQSNVFGRIYDKWEESKEDYFAGCVRYEGQYQNRLAWHVANSLYATGSPIILVASYLSQFFQGRGVPLELQVDPTARYSCSRLRSDDDKNLSWLQNAVRPTVRRLIDSGKGEEVFRALGLIDE